MIVATVLKSGGDFEPAHVVRLYQQIKQHNPKAEVYCLTDIPQKLPDRIHKIQLRHNWPGWWSKIELFRPGVFKEPVLYMDLDTTILGDVSQFYSMPLKMLPNVYLSGRVGSGVMSWGYDLSEIYRTFVDNDWVMQLYRTGDKWGDQAFIEDTCPCAISTYDAGVYSYKAHCQNGIPDDCAIMYFHGKPRPWEVGY